MAAQQSVDPTQTINDAAAAIAAGKSVDLVTLKAAAGWTTRLAGANEDENTMRLITLIGAQDYQSALHLLVDLSFGDDGAQTTSADDDGLDDMLGGGTATVQQPAVTPTTRPVPTAPVPPQAPAAAPAAPTTTTPVRSGRRAQRPAGN